MIHRPISFNPIRYSMPQIESFVTFAAITRLAKGLQILDIARAAFANWFDMIDGQFVKGKLLVTHQTMEIIELTKAIPLVGCERAACFSFAGAITGLCLLCQYFAVGLFASLPFIFLVFRRLVIARKIPICPCFCFGFFYGLLASVGVGPSFLDSPSFRTTGILSMVSSIFFLLSSPSGLSLILRSGLRSLNAIFATGIITVFDCPFFEEIPNRFSFTTLATFLMRYLYACVVAVQCTFLAAILHTLNHIMLVFMKTAEGLDFSAFRTLLIPIRYIFFLTVISLFVFNQTTLARVTKSISGCFAFVKLADGKIATSNFPFFALFALFHKLGHWRLSIKKPYRLKPSFLSKKRSESIGLIRHDNSYSIKRQNDLLTTFLRHRYYTIEREFC